MNVFEVRLKIYLLKDILLEDAQMKISAFIDRGLLLNKELKDFHESNKYKNYCFDLLYPIEKK